METIPSLLVGTERLIDSEDFIRDTYPSSSDLEDEFANVPNESLFPPDTVPAPLHEITEPIVPLSAADAPPALPGSAAYTGQPVPVDPATQESLGMLWKAPESAKNGPSAAATATVFPSYMGIPASQVRQRHAFGLSDQPISPRPPDLGNNPNRAIQPAWNQTAHSSSFSQLAGQAPSFRSGPPFSSGPPSFSSRPASFSSRPASFSSMPASFSSRPASFSSGPPSFRAGPPSFRTGPPSCRSAPPPPVSAQTSVGGRIADVQMIDRQLSPVLSAPNTHCEGTDPGNAVSTFSRPSSAAPHDQQARNQRESHPDLPLRPQEDFNALSHSSGLRNLHGFAPKALPGGENYSTLAHNDVFETLRNTREAPTVLAAALCYNRTQNLSPQKPESVALHGEQAYPDRQENKAGQNLGGNLSAVDDRQVESSFSGSSQGQIGAGSSSDGRRPSGTVVSAEKTRKTPRKRAQFKNPTPSNFCHICTHKKEPHEALVCSCIHEGLCRKVYCTQCFEKEGLSMENAPDSDGQWLCFHCRDECPRRAQCNTYNRINNNIRDKRIQRKRGKEHRRRGQHLAGNNAPVAPPSPPSPSKAELRKNRNGAVETREITKREENELLVDDIKPDRENLDDIINSCFSAAGESPNGADDSEEEIS